MQRKDLVSITTVLLCFMLSASCGQSATKASTSAPTVAAQSLPKVHVDPFAHIGYSQAVRCHLLAVYFNQNQENDGAILGKVRAKAAQLANVRADIVVPYPDIKGDLMPEPTILMRRLITLSAYSSESLWMEFESSFLLLAKD